MSTKNNKKYETISIESLIWQLLGKYLNHAEDGFLAQKRWITELGFKKPVAKLN
jgi:hypothetical protein